jgi:hypothetical protein
MEFNISINTNVDVFALVSLVGIMMTFTLGAQLLYAQIARTW